MKIVFAPVIAPAASAIGEALVPREFRIEILATDDPKRRIDQLETAGRTVGIIGLGMIGKVLARRLMGDVLASRRPSLQ